MKFRYNKTLDAKVKKAVAAVLKTEVLTAQKTTDGEVNHVYKVETKKGIFIARIFKNKYWPEDGKLQWIERQLRKHKIPHAKMLYYTRKGPHFPYGFMITEFIEGKMARLAIENGDMTREQFYAEVAKTLRKVHRIKTKRFGNWKNGLGHSSSFVKEWQEKVRIRIRELKGSKYYDEELEERVVILLGKLLTPLEKKLKPVLTHGDPGNDNCIWTNDKHLVLIDWDNALAAIWLRDLADLTYWGSYAKSLGRTGEERRKKIRRAFLKGYGKVNLTPVEISRVEKALHMYHAVNLMPYYNDDKRWKPLRNAQKRIYELAGFP